MSLEKMMQWLLGSWMMVCKSGNLMVIWYIIPRFGLLFQEKSGNPAFTPSHFLGSILRTIVSYNASVVKNYNAKK
jgi:hypothetical protein